MSDGEQTGHGRMQRRIEVGLSMRIRGKESDGAPFEDLVHTANVSRTGASFATMRKLQVGSQVEITIPRRPGDRAEEGDFVTQARIVRMLPGSNDREKIVGVQFLERRFHRVFVSETTS